MVSAVDFVGNRGKSSSSPLTFNEHIQRLEVLTNLITSRADFVNRNMEDGRDVDKSCKYPSLKSLAAEDFREMYDYEAVASRVVEILPQESWQVQPNVYEMENAEEWTPFEEAWQQMGKDLRGQSWYQDEAGGSIWEYLLRVDILSGVGSYGVLLLGLGDNKELNQPAAGIDEFGRSAQLTANLVAPDKPAVGEPTKLLFLRAFDESMARITKLEERKNNPRFGQPTEYEIDFSDPTIPTSVETGLATGKQTVHWTRVLHVVDNPGTSEVRSRSRMRPVYKRLLDLRKLYSGSAEMYWLGAFGGLSLEVDPEFAASRDGLTPEEIEQYKTAMHNYQNSLVRYLALIGASVKSLAPQVVDPTRQIMVQLTAICIQLGCPLRVFTGSEAGQLASTQDDSAWNDRLRKRQINYLTPRLIVPFVDRLIMLGVLPVPEGFSVWWPDLGAMTQAQQSTLALQKADSMARYVDGNVKSVMAPMDFLTRVMGYTQDEAAEIVLAAEELATMEAQAQLDAQIALAEATGVDENGNPIAGAGGASNGSTLPNSKANSQKDRGPTNARQANKDLPVKRPRVAEKLKGQ